MQSRNIRIWLDADKLKSFNLSAADVLQALQRQHAELPAGYIKSSLVEFNLRTMGEAYSVKEFERIVISRPDTPVRPDFNAQGTAPVTGRTGVSGPPASNPTEASGRQLQSIYLSDVAVIEDGLEDRRSLARYNRMPAVAVGVRKAIGGNLVAVCENVKAELPRLRRMLPEGVELSIPVDYSLFVRENVEELQLTLLLGIVLTAGVCFLFLGSIGTTINICLSIPTSLVGTFFVLNYGMKLIGVEPFTINLMTLLGLSLSVGVVVDDAILVLENIYRHREQGQERKQAALLGAREISFAAMAATFSIMAIFLPVAFMTGVIGRFFFQFGVTVGVAVFLSLLCALTLTPMLCAFFLNLHERIPHRPLPFRIPLALLAGLGAALIGTVLRILAYWIPGLATWSWPLLSIFDIRHSSLDIPAVRWFIETAAEFVLAFLLTRYGNLLYWLLDRFLLEPLLIRPTEWLLRQSTAGYARLLAWSLRHWAAVLGFGVILMAAAAGFLYFDVLGRELVPSEDQSRFVVHVVCPVGSSIDQVDELLQECEAVLVSRDDVEGILTTVATERGQLINEADIFVHLKPQHERGLRQQGIMRQVRTELEKIHDIRVAVRDQSTEGFTAQRGDPVDFAIQGDWKRLPMLAEAIMGEMAASGVVQDIDSDYRSGMAEVRIIPDRDKLAQVNVPVKHVADSMSLLVGGQRVAKYTDHGRRYDVRIRLRSEQRASPNDLDTLAVRAGDNRLVPLSDVTTRRTVSTLPVINRFNHQRKIEITASPAPGVSQGEAIAVCQEITRQVLPPDEFEVIELGNAKAMKETLESLIFALVLGVIIAYMILGVQFNSFVHPLTVLLAMPFAVTGALVTLWLTSDTLNMMSMIGLILLMGLVKKNSIILVDYTNQLRQPASGGRESPGEPPAAGLSVEDAVLTACPIRLRPILMTSLATVADAIPAALGLGPGAETRAPMARAIIGGIVLSTLVTLVLVPVFYVLIERLRDKSRTMFRSPRSDRIS